MGLHIHNVLTDHVQSHSLEGLRLNDEYVFGKRIGAGTFGLIHLIENRAGEVFAAKVLFRQKDPAPELIYRTLASGSATLADLDNPGSDPLLVEMALQHRVGGHPNIAQVHHVYCVQDAVVGVMEYFPGGDLFSAIIERNMFGRPATASQRQLLMKNCMLQLIDAVAHCASHTVFHCDLKPENVMVSYNPDHVRRSDEPIDYGELRISLIDFGLAMSAEMIGCNVCRGSNFYMAPERIVNFSQNRLVGSILDTGRFAMDMDQNGVCFPTLAGDIWSLGVLFINVTCARNPWPVANINDRNDVFHTYILRDKTVLRTILPISEQFNELLDTIFVLDPNSRANLSTLGNLVRKCDFFPGKKTLGFCRPVSTFDTVETSNYVS